MMTSKLAFERVFSALLITQFRWLWSSMFFSSMSMGVRMLAQGWLVLEITDSAFWVGTAAGIQGLGVVGFGILGGTIVDRFDKKKILVTLHLCNAVLVVSIGALILSGEIELWHILISALLQGMVMATQIPSVNSMVYQIVGPDRLLNAMAARLLAMNVSRIVGSIIAGFIIVKIGIGFCYMFSGIASLAGMILLVFIKSGFHSSIANENFWLSTSKGLQYIWSTPTIKRLLLVSLIMETFGFSHLIILPVIAKDVLNVDAFGLGILSASSGLGATISTLGVAALGNFKNKGMLLTVTAMFSGVSLLIFAFSQWFFLSMIIVAWIGGSLMAYDVTMGTLLQLIARQDMRGRVLGLYGLTFGFTPLGGFIVGWVASVLSAPIAVAAGGFIITAYLSKTSRILIRIKAD